MKSKVYIIAEVKVFEKEFDGVPYVKISKQLKSPLLVHDSTFPPRDGFESEIVYLNQYRYPEDNNSFYIGYAKGVNEKLFPIQCLSSLHEENINLRKQNKDYWNKLICKQILLNEYKTMSFWKRLIFLFKGKI